MPSIDQLIENMEQQMMDALDALERDFSAYRTGKASPALVENIMVSYYGTMTRLRDIAGITTPEARLLVIQPWDPNALVEIEKALNTADIGISPVNDGRILRLPVPDLSEERRRALIKQVGKRVEEAKVELRNYRRAANEEIKRAEKESEVTEDERDGLLEEVQKTTDDYMKQIDTIARKKEAELLQV